MGMTLWLHTLEDRNYSKDSDDYSLLYRFSEKLDALCENAGVHKLSDYFDFTDLEHEFSQDDLEDDDDEPALDPETGWAYGIDDMNWFDAAEGSATLTILRDGIAADALEGLAEDEKQGLLEELTDCLAILQGPAARSGKFHLSVVS